MNEEYFIETKCLFCEQAEDSVLYPQLFEKDTFSGYTFSARRERKREHYRIVVCNKCGLVRSNPIIDENKLNDLYAKSYFIFSDEAPYASQTYIMLLKYLTDKYNGNDRIKSLLEIGCSTGFFLEKVMQMGISDVVGFEPSKDCCENAGEDIKGKIINDVFNPEVIGEKKFDLACSFHVFDHLTDPKRVLLSIVKSLNPNGHVLLVCHDVESWGAKLLGDYNPIFDVEHVYLFSKKTISLLLESAGLTVLEAGSLSNTYPLGYWMRMLPVMNKVARMLPENIKKIPIKLKAGNLYAYARKTI
ncbi:MAG: class I SAM-dependent methyltransferase [Nitrospirae bacterium]|nr:class I SAM-dependent methyltransferase [Nitrospirota bacterium]